MALLSIPGFVQDLNYYKRRNENQAATAKSDDDESSDDKSDDEATAKQERPRKTAHAEPGDDDLMSAFFNTTDPNERDVILSTTNEAYKTKMYDYYRKMGTKQFRRGEGGKEKEAALAIMQEFKMTMARSGGRFLKCENWSSRTPKYYVVNDEDAQKSKMTLLVPCSSRSQWIIHSCSSLLWYLHTEIYQDLARRNTTAHIWEVDETIQGAQAKRRKTMKSNATEKAVDHNTDATPIRAPSRASCGAATMPSHRATESGQAKAGRHSTGGYTAPNHAGSNNFESPHTTNRQAADVSSSSEFVDKDQLRLSYKDIKQKVASSKGAIGKKFYGHLKRYLSQRYDTGVLSSDFDKLLDYMARFQERLDDLNAEDNDHDDIILFEGAVNDLMKKCEEDLPLAR